ncbi:hypothetical protein BHM03_00043838 [Ensete ventricosum]|nr:hypothetical protein BHM03_00043838 [Ensete ventricosum]
MWLILHGPDDCLIPTTPRVGTLRYCRGRAKSQPPNYEAPQKRQKTPRHGSTTLSGRSLKRPPVATQVGWRDLRLTFYARTRCSSFTTLAPSVQPNHPCNVPWVKSPPHGPVSVGPTRQPHQRPPRPETLHRGSHGFSMCLSRFERDASHQGWGEGTKGTLRHDLGYDRDASGVVPKTKRAAPSFAVHKKFSISPLGKGRRRPETDAVAFSRMIERSPFLWVHVSTSEWLGTVLRPSLPRPHYRGIASGLTCQGGGYGGGKARSEHWAVTRKRTV